MLEQQLIDEFRQRLIGETKLYLEENSRSNGALQQDTALAEVILGDLEEAGAIAEHELCPYEDTTGRNRCRVVAYALPEEGTRLELITSAYVAPGIGDYLSTENLSRVTGQAARFFDYIARGELGRFEEHPTVLDAAARIREALGSIDEVRIHVLTNAFVRDRSVNDLEIAGRRVEFSVWDLERLYRASGEEVTRDRIEIDFSKLLGGPLTVLEMKPPPAEYQTFLLVLPGEALYKLYDQFGPRLFEFNVRSFLQARGQVNRGIRETLRAQPDRFLAYNNGLTATADEIVVGTLRGETVIHSLRGLQIVNGAQTTASIHRAKKIDRIDISRVAVSMKLTRVEPAKLGEFVPLIAKFANTQNPVQLADLSANNDFHIIMERLSEQVWAPGEEERWFYERARGAYQVARMRLGTSSAKRRDFDLRCPKSQRFTKTDLAKVWMTWWDLPHVVSRGAQKNFAAFMSALPERFPANWVPDQDFYRQSVALLILFKGCQAAVRLAALQSYGANVVTFMMAKLKEIYGARLDLNRIWEAQALSPELAEVLGHWAPEVHAAIVANAGSRNVTEFSKKEECWERIRMLALARPASSTPEMRDSQALSNATLAAPISQTNMIDRCMALNGTAWAAVVAWATGSATVTEFDKKVAHTLLGYAMNDWQHRPSERQAPIGVRVLDLAERAGIPINRTVA
ncbi:MAG: AIPR family protein [Caulobacteraceae bacterium]